jgi:hypothetical protein
LVFPRQEDEDEDEDDKENELDHQKVGDDVRSRCFFEAEEI